MAREYIDREDLLNTGREKLNRSIDKSYDAEETSVQALEDANVLGNKAIADANKLGNESIAIAKENEKVAGEANLIAKDTNERMNQIISGETDSAEVIDSRKPIGLEATETLGERLNLQFGNNSDFRPEDVALIKKMKSEFEDRSENPAWYGAVLDGEIDDQAAIQKILDESLSKRGTKITFPKNKTFKISQTIDLKSFNFIDFNGCTLIPDLPVGSTFKVFSTSNTGDVTLKNLRSSDTKGIHDFFGASGRVEDNNDPLNNYKNVFYVRKFSLENIYLHNYRLCVDARFVKQIIITDCRLEGVLNGVLIKDKSVEMNISKTLIFGKMEKDSFGIKTETTYQNAWHYPEGLMIDSCTIDNFDKSIEINSGFAFKITNSYIATKETGTAAIYFGNKGISSHNEQFIISNLVIGGKGIIFRPEVSPPTKYKSVLNSIVFANIKGPAIELGKYAHDISISNLRCYGSPENTSLAIVGVGDNKDLNINDVFIDSYFAGGVVLNSVTSTGNKVDNINYTGTGPILYYQAPLKASNIPYQKGQSDQLYRMTNVTSQTAKKGDVISKLSALDYAKGTRLRLRVQVPLTTVTGSTVLNIKANANFSIPGGDGWSASFISVTNPQFLTYELILRCAEDIANETIELLHNSGSDITLGYHGNMSLEVI